MSIKDDEKAILLVGCAQEIRACLEPTIRSLHFSVDIAQNADEAHSLLQSSEREISALIVDAMMPGQEGVEIVRAARARDPHLAIIAVAGRPSTEDIVAAMKCGASDFLSMPITHERTLEILTRALEGCDSRRVPGRNGQEGAGFFAGANARIREIQALLDQVGHSKVPVLIQGETGSGKEVLARTLHNRSACSNRPFLKLNCAALPSELVESELFGYERGAFTGAFKRKEGMFELADGGTLLLDEIGDMDIRLQAKLLQVLQDREFRRIGGRETVKVDVRIIAATHRDLEQAIYDRTFREDLYYRLNVVNFVLPPLRERKEDIISIAEFLLRRHAIKDIPVPHINMELRQAMLAYDWPGNVRELENYMRKLIIFQDGNVIARELRARAARKQPTAPRVSELNAPYPNGITRVSALEEATRAKERAETEVILAALNSTRWNRKQAAAMLGIDYKSLLYKMKKLGIESGPVAVPAQDDEAFAALRSASGD